MKLVRGLLAVFVFTAVASAANKRAPTPAPIKPPAKPAPAPTKPAADTRTRAQVQAAADFAFEGVSLGASLDAFLAKHPGAEPLPAETNPTVGSKGYRVTALESADAAEYLFLDGALFQMTVSYLPARLKDMGGDTIPFRKLVQKFGKQDTKSPGITRSNGEEGFVARWDFPDASRRISFVATAKATYVAISDPAKASLIKKRTTDEAELGF